MKYGEECGCDRTLLGRRARPDPTGGGRRPARVVEGAGARPGFGVDGRKEVTEPDEGEPGLGWPRTTREHPHPAFVGAPHSLLPERRLSDPRLALDDERGRPVARQDEELFDDCELRISADNRSSGHGRRVGASARRRSPRSAITFYRTPGLRWRARSREPARASGMYPTCQRRRRVGAVRRPTSVVGKECTAWKTRRAVLRSKSAHGSWYSRAPALDRSVANDDSVSVGRDLPTGTVTFLFTDVEGSTRLLHELGADAYADALAEHRRVVRDVCAAHGGVEVDTQGTLSSSPSSPPRGRSRRRRRSRTGSPPGRSASGSGCTRGHHSSPTRARGPDVHRAARIAASGNGGQVLASSSTASLVGHGGLRDLGEHRLEDLSSPERIYQLGEEDFPALKSLYRTNLPVPATPFLGREKETRGGRRPTQPRGRSPAHVDRPRRHRQDPACAPSRRRGLGSLPGRDQWVPLAPLRDPALLLPAVTQALELNEEPEKPLTETLATALAGKRTLLVLDNVEHLLPGAAVMQPPSATSTARKCSSRVGNGFASVASRPGRCRRSPSPTQSLFTARALAVDPSFAATPATAHLCARLDDLPLAIELAAGLQGSSAPTSCFSGSRTDLTSSRAIGGPTRASKQCAPRSTGPDLLPPDERRLFRSSRLFAGGSRDRT